MKVWAAKDFKNEVAVVTGIRTPFAKAGTKLKDSSAVHLGVTAMRETLSKVDVTPDQVDEVVFGNAGTPADAANISRVMALRAGFPESVSAYTVHRNCASAMEAVAQGCLKIGAGLADTMLVGGTESMSNFPLLYGEEMTELFTKLNFAKSTTEKLEALSHFRLGQLKPIAAIMEGLTDPISGLNMGQTAENLAKDFRITRKMQDEYAVRSHQRTVEAAQLGKFQDEIIPTIIEPDFKEFLDADIGPRENQSLEQLGKLKPFFDRENGTVTPGNACPITDGAVGLLLMNKEKAKSLGLSILGTISGYSFTGCDPSRMGMGPIYSSSLLLDALKYSLSDIDLVELNEAFAAQVIANQIAFGSKQYCVEKLGRSKELGELTPNKLNVNGGAIALGHPVGATGARLILTLLLEMKRRKVGKGLATLCIGGGQGGAFLLEQSV